MAHEIGHFLGLYHTHNTSFGKELADQSNCEEAGDLICDTPADPRLSSSIVSSFCVYTGTEIDLLGNLYEPDPELVMSYSRKSCRHVFTAEQGTVMRNVCQDYYPNYLCDPDVISSISESDNTKVQVFPNPVRNVLNIELSKNQPFQSSLYNLQGMLVSKSVNELQISVDALPDGIYVLEIKDLNLGHVAVQRVVISR